MKRILSMLFAAGAASLLSPASSTSWAQGAGALDQSAASALKLVDDLEAALRWAEAARLRGDCSSVEHASSRFYGFHMMILPPELAADFQRRMRDIADAPCPPLGTTPSTSQRPAPPSSFRLPRYGDVRYLWAIFPLAAALDAAIEACDPEAFKVAKNRLLATIGQMMRLSPNDPSLLADRRRVEETQFPRPCPPEPGVGTDGSTTEGGLEVELYNEWMLPRGSPQPRALPPRAPPETPEPRQPEQQQPRTQSIPNMLDPLETLGGGAQAPRRASEAVEAPRTEGSSQAVEAPDSSGAEVGHQPSASEVDRLQEPAGDTRSKPQRDRQRERCAKPEGERPADCPKR